MDIEQVNRVQLELSTESVRLTTWCGCTQVVRILRGESRVRVPLNMPATLVGLVVAQIVAAATIAFLLWMRN